MTCGLPLANAMCVHWRHAVAPRERDAHRSAGRRDLGDGATEGLQARSLEHAEDSPTVRCGAHAGYDAKGSVLGTANGGNSSEPQASESFHEPRSETLENSRPETHDSMAKSRPKSSTLHGQNQSCQESRVEHVRTFQLYAAVAGRRSKRYTRSPKGLPAWPRTRACGSAAVDHISLQHAESSRRAGSVIGATRGNQYRGCAPNIDGIGCAQGCTKIARYGTTMARRCGDGSEFAF